MWINPIFNNKNYRYKSQDIHAITIWIIKVKICYWQKYYNRVLNKIKKEYQSTIYCIKNRLIVH